jgi:hypothetical protein
MKRKLLVMALFGVLVLGGCRKGNSSVVSSLSANSASSSLSSVSPSSLLPSSTVPLPDGETYKAATTLVANAARDGITTDVKTVLSATGYTGNETLTKTRAFNLFYRVYKDHMPEQIGYRKYDAYSLSTPYADVPAEAQDAVTFLSGVGLLTPETDESGAEITAFNGDEAFPEKLMKTYLDRFHAYFGTSKTDDFSSYVNADFIYTNADFKDKTPSDDITDTNLVSQKAINSWVINHISSMAEGDSKTKIDHYTAAYEDLTQKAAGKCSGAFTDYQSILNTTTYAELFDRCAAIFKTTGSDPLFQKTAMSGELAIPKKITPIFSSFYPSEYAQMDLTEGSADYQHSVQLFTDILSGVGFDADTSRKYAVAGTKTIASIVKVYLTNLAAAKGVDTYDGIKTDETLGKQSFSLKDHLDKAGFLSPFSASALGGTGDVGYCRSIFRNGVSLRSFFQAMEDSALDGYKAIVLLQDIVDFLPCNPSAVASLINSKYTTDYLNEENMRRDFYNVEVEDSLISAFKETKEYRNNLALISKSITEIRERFREMIAGETWLSEEGKQSAIAKDDNVKTSILASNDNATGLKLREPDYQADSLYKDISLCQRALIDECVANDRDLDFYTMQNFSDHFTANAFYTPSSNSITILFGYLAAHGDFASMSKEQLFSDLYLCCGHELTHGFDTKGVLFDQDGKQNINWLSPEDLSAYQARTETVQNYYDGYEVMPGSPTPGATVISEACADIAGAKIVLSLAKDVPDFDYDKFFTYMGKTFYSLASRSAYYNDGLAGDVHPYGRARVNRILSSLDEFYTTYGIKEGDGMYVAPSDRPEVW